MTEDEARVAYARWFVRHYYLSRCRVDYSYDSKVRRCQERGYIRYKKITWPVGSKLYPEGKVFLRDEYDYEHFSTHWHEKPEQTWWRLPWGELDNPINDENPIVASYRRYRELAAENAVLAWLQAEAEFEKVSAEAWLRSYGVDIQAP